MGESTSISSIIASLIKLLPTGTVFLYQFLDPVFSNNGDCQTVNKYLTGFLLGICGLSCFLSCFTDSYTGSDGKTHYGIVTFTGLHTLSWPWSSSKDEAPKDSSSYKFRLRDLVHALFVVLVFGVVVILDPNTVKCFYPSLADDQATLLKVLPPVVGAVSGVISVLFPNKRNYIAFFCPEMAAKKSISEKSLSGFAKILKLLPTGTVFLFQFLSPVLTNNGKCQTVNKYLTGFLLGVCGLSCFFSSFTDSYKGSDGKTHYGIVTFKGLWPSPKEGTSIDLSQYKLRLGDFVHAFFAVTVFAVVVVLDPNTVKCFYPSLAYDQKTLLKVLPPAVGAVSGVVFMLFPNKRHYIGYPAS
ncbi:Protein DMP [Dillenia turbinata]|uniref:Protein DMP n=1 Tax=Dillenia turbinata TaxID=194707 RepID=A0AAN8VB00_9MAGN